MKALTLTQPWASLVALGHKRIETRSWSTSYVGSLAIHAAKGYPVSAREFAAEEMAFGRLPGRIPMASIVAVANLAGCRFTQDVAPQISALERRLGDYYHGRYAWMLDDIIALPEPIPARGALGLWTPTPDVLLKIVSVLAGGTK